MTNYSPNTFSLTPQALIVGVLSLSTALLSGCSGDAKVAENGDSQGASGGAGNSSTGGSTAVDDEPGSTGGADAVSGGGVTVDDLLPAALPATDSEGCLPFEASAALSSLNDDGSLCKQIRLCTSPVPVADTHCGQATILDLAASTTLPATDDEARLLCNVGVESCQADPVQGLKLMSNAQQFMSGLGCSTLGTCQQTVTDAEQCFADQMLLAKEYYTCENLSLQMLEALREPTAPESCVPVMVCLGS